MPARDDHELSLATRVFLLAACERLALALAFPNYNLSLLAWISGRLAGACVVRRAAPVAPLYGILHGLVFYPMCLPWMAS